MLVTASFFDLREILKCSLPLSLIILKASKTFFPTFLIIDGSYNYLQSNDKVLDFFRLNISDIPPVEI